DRARCVGVRGVRRRVSAGVRRLLHNGQRRDRNTRTERIARRSEESMTMRPGIATAPDGSHAHLAREMSLLGLVATAFGAMIGIGINILPFMVQRSQPGVGAHVPLADLIAAVPAGLAAPCYA